MRRSFLAPTLGAYIINEFSFTLLANLAPFLETSKSSPQRIPKLSNFSFTEITIYLFWYLRFYWFSVLLSLICKILFQGNNDDLLLGGPLDYRQHLQLLNKRIRKPNVTPTSSPMSPALGLPGLRLLMTSYISGFNWFQQTLPEIFRQRMPPVPAIFHPLFLRSHNRGIGNIYRRGVSLQGLAFCETQSYPAGDIGNGYCHTILFYLVFHIFILFYCCKDNH